MQTTHFEIKTKPYGMTVRAIIADDAGRMLLLRRAEQSRNFVGEWEFPGGKMDDGENVGEALCREVREETGLEIGIDRVACVTEFEMPHIRVAMLCFYAQQMSGELRLSEEHDEFAWVAPDAMVALPLTHVMRDVWAGIKNRSRHQMP